ncbi:MAG: glycosyltransferase family 4 protein [Solirubrobacteraceae bacterium]
MRIALVSPYSWTYPGGVTRHVRALAEQFIDRGHDVDVLAPFDPPGKRSRRLHRGDEPEHLEPPPYLVDLGRTVGLHANGARSNLMLAPSGIFRLRERLRSGDYDVVHVHEPIAPTVSWDAVGVTSAPLVGTFHTYSTNSLTNNLGNIAGARRRFQRLHVRIAVSKAAEWTGLRYFGGRYRVIPNGVALPEHVVRAEAVRPTAERPLRVAFVGQAVERKGLPVALLAFAALREQLPAELTIVGADAAKLDELAPVRPGVTALGKVTDEEKMAVLASSDLLVASSLGGESFGMVLTEAFAAGTPVVASDIAGYIEVVSDGVDGALFPRGDAQALASVLLELADDPGRRTAMSLAAAAKAERFAWPQVADEVLAAYADAIAMPKATGIAARLGVTLGLRSADLAPRVPAQRRLPSVERDPHARTRRLRPRRDAERSPLEQTT